MKHLSILIVIVGNKTDQAKVLRNEESEATVFINWVCGYKEIEATVCIDWMRGYKEIEAMVCID